VWWIIEFCNLLGTGFTKISILLFVRRISLTSANEWLSWSLLATIILVALSTVVFEISLFIECRPLGAFWLQVNPIWRMTEQYHCANEGKKLLAAGIVSVIQDFLVTTLPLFLIWNIQLTRSKKTGIIAIFGIGYLVCAMGLARVVYTHTVFFSTWDITWWAPVLGVWTVAELCTGIMVACAPALKVCFQNAKSSIKASTPFWRSKDMNNSVDQKEMESSTESRRSGVGLYTQVLKEIEVSHELNPDSMQYQV
jgi:hypothetical protein